MAAKALPPLEVLNQFLRCDADAGRLYWLPRECGGNGGTARWLKLFAGKEAFTQTEAQGYRVGRIEGDRYKAHRVIWKMATGDEPKEIDHINGDRQDNRLSNLRSVSRLENTHNRRRSVKNATGETGVFWHTASGKWVAKIGERHLGTFADFDQAVAARKAAETDLGYHENHGRG